MSFSPSLSVLTSVFQGENYLRGFLDNLQNQTIFPEIELILVLNAPTTIEKRMANDLAVRHPERVVVHLLKNAEPLGASWNRAWETAKAPYVAIWNVDDRRNVDSLQRQLASLEQDPESVLSYGDYIKVDAYGKEIGCRRTTPTYSRGHFSRAFAQGGAFWVLRRGLRELLGGFDEQFRVGVDMEYSFRIAARGLKMRRCSGVLGFFTDSSEGLSTREAGAQALTERTAIQQRFGVFDKVPPSSREAASPFRLDAIQSGHEWIPLTRYLPDHKSWLSKREYLWALGAMRDRGKAFLKRVGILGFVHRLQNTLLKREI
jgi:GT2 family glycosyltransferase